jgi:general secretion pathway protein F
MPRFAYTARRPAGDLERGAIEAASRRDAARQLAGGGLRPLELIEAAGRKARDAVGADAGSVRWTRKHRLPFLTALSRLVSGGLSAGEAVRLLAHRLRDPGLRSLSAALWEQLSQGRTLSQALTDHPQVFDDQTTNLVAAGEATGSLKEVLPRLIQHFTEQRELRQKLVAALAYPVFVCVLAGGVILFFLFFLLPRLQVLLNSLGGKLPPSTRLLVGMSDFLIYYGPFVLIAVIVGVLSWWQWRRTPAGRQATDAWLVRAPFAGTYAARTTVLNFTHTVAILLENGITTSEALRMAERTVTNTTLRKRFHVAIDRVLEGESLSLALGRTQLLPPLVLDQLAVGEQTGRLAPSLRAIAQDYQIEVTQWLQHLTRFISAAVFGAAFGFVGFLAYAIISAVLQVSSSFKF